MMSSDHWEREIHDSRWTNRMKVTLSSLGQGTRMPPQPASMPARMAIGVMQTITNTPALISHLGIVLSTAFMYRCGGMHRTRVIADSRRRMGTTLRLACKAHSKGPITACEGNVYGISALVNANGRCRYTALAATASISMRQSGLSSA